MRILIALRDRLDRDPIAADLAGDRREILGRRHDVELALARAPQIAQRAAQQREDADDSVAWRLHNRAPSNLERMRAVRTDRKLELEQQLVRPIVDRSRVVRAAVLARTWLNSLGQ